MDTFLKKGVHLKISSLVSRPYHVHFFQNFAKEMEKKGHKVLLFHTGNELTQKLLEPLQIKNKIYGRHFKKRATAAVSSLYNKASLLRGLKKFEPDLILSLNGSPLSPFNSLLDAPTIVFLDTRPLRREEYFIFNYSTKIITPACYHADLPKKKTLCHSSYHPLAYLHPNWFSPSTKVLDALDIEPKDYVIASFGRNLRKKIDIRKHPLRRRQVIDLVRKFDEHCTVFVDKRGYVPEILEEYCPPIHPVHYQDLLANSALVIGDNPVVSAEAGVLGTPWIHISNHTTFTLEEQEIKYEIGSQIPNLDEAIELGEMILSGELELDLKNVRKNILKDKSDLTKWMLYMTRSMKKRGYFS